MEQALYQAQLDLYLPGMPPPAVLVLGATPMFHELDWPAGTHLLAADRSAEMLSQLWPGGEESTLQTDWDALQLEDACQHIVLTDGGLCFYDYPGDLEKIAETVARVLAEQGVLIARVFVPDPDLNSDRKLADAISRNEVANESELKIALWNLVALDSSGTVRLAEAATRFDAIAESHPQLLNQFHWVPAARDSLKAYRSMPDRYFLSSVEQLRQAFGSAGLQLRAELMPQCNLNACIRLLTFQKS